MATSAAAATFPCSIGPSDIAGLTFVNPAGNSSDPSSFALGGVLTTANISATTGDCNNLPNGSIRPVAGNPASAALDFIVANATTQGGWLVRTASDEVRYLPPSSAFSGTDTFQIDNNNLGRVINVTVSVLSLVDTTPPPAPVIASPANGDVLGNSAPTISGTAEANATVTVYLDGSSVATLSASSFGFWSFTSPLSEGAHSVYATATDASNNTSPNSTTVNFTVDTTPPPAPIVTAPANGSTIGDTTPTVTGTAEAASTVTVAIDGVSAGSATANGTGNWSFTPSTPLAYGAHTVGATATDAAGNTSVNSATNSFTILQSPIASDVVATVAANSTNNPITPVISGGTPSSFTIGTPPAHGTAVASGTSITYTPTAGYSGSDSFTYTAGNSSGTSALATVSITVTAPTLTLGAIDLDGQVTVPYSDTVSASGGTAPYSFAVTGNALPTGLTLAPGGAITGTPTTAGASSFTITATDSNGATGTGNYSIDIGAPTVQLTAPVAGPLPAASLGTAYGPITFTASGGNTPHSFTVSAGTLPPGLSLTAGVLAGTPTAAGSYSFSVTPMDGSGAGAGGPFPGTAVAYEVEVSSPSVAFVVESAEDGAFTFNSAEPSLNFVVNATGGGGTSGQLAVPAGSHSISFTAPAGFEIASATCNSPGSSLDSASRSGTILVQAGDEIVCTIVAGDIRPTTELIGAFLEARANLIVANQPDSARRLERLTGSYSSSAGVAGFGLTVPGQLPIAMRFTGDQASFAYSLGRAQAEPAAGSENTAADDTSGGVLPIPYADQATGGSDNRPPFGAPGVDAVDEVATEPLATPFDLWIEGKLARFNAPGGDGRFGIVHGGADYLVGPRVLVGLGVQLDWTEMEGNGDATIEGTGYLVGPYLTARLTDGLFLDARAAWGQSSNTASPLGTYSDQLDGTRWLVSAALIGQYDIDRWRIAPTARLTYFEEKTDAYTDGLGLPIPEVEIATGTFEFGPRISYQTELDNGTAFQPFVSLEGVWTFEQKNTGTSATSSPGLADTGLRGRSEVGFSLSGGAGSVSASAFYDGLGDNDFESWGGKLRFNKTF